MTKRRIIQLSIGLVLIVAIFFIVRGSASGTESGLIISPKKGPFTIDVTTTGELEAKNSVKILGPGTLRNHHIWNVTIQSIIPEGTYVTKGQRVANLDPSEVRNKLNEANLELQKVNSQFIQTKLDTTLQMRESRDELINLDYAVTEKRLVLEQSKFEPPAQIQKAEIELEKAKRGLEQAKENYKIKREQNIAKMSEVAADRRQVSNQLEGLQQLERDFTILAPEDGMLIYKKDWRGSPIKEGSQIGAWDPVVATLPDLSKMMSKTFVNEVDIRRIQQGQDVVIGLDAFPDKKLSGKVVKVANVGEQRPNSDAKVFQVDIEVNESDDLIKPAMTTSNKILVEAVEEALFIPLECLHSQNDSITYVYVKRGLNIVKKEVMLGQANANEVIVDAGLNEEDQIYLSSPLGYEDDEVELLSELNGKRGNGATVSQSL